MDEGREVSSVEKMISSVSESSVQPTDQTAQKEGKQIIKQLCSSADGIDWLISNFRQFLMPSTKKFTFLLIHYWCSHNWSHLDQNYLPKIQSFIFCNVLPLCSSFDEDTVEKLSKSQSQFIIQSGVESTLQSISSILSHSDPFHFLKAFCGDLVLPSPCNPEGAHSIKVALCETGLIQQIYAVVFEGIRKLNQTAFLALASLCRWSELSWVGNADKVNLFLAGLQNESTAASAIQVLISLAIRGVEVYPPEELVHQVIQAFPRQDVLLSAANLVQNIGFLSKMDDYHDTALVFLENPDDTTADAVLSYFFDFLIRNPQEGPQLFPKFFSRLAMYLTNSPFPVVSPFSDQLLRLMRLSFKPSAEIPIEDSPASIATLLLFLYEVGIYKIRLEGITEYFDAYYQLIFFDPPFDVSLFAVVYSYCKLPIAYPENFSAEKLTEIFQRVLCFSASDLPHHLSEKFYQIAQKYLRAFQSKITIESQSIIECVSSLNPLYVSIAGAMVGSMPEGRQAEIVQSCMEILVQAISSDGSQVSPAVLFIPEIPPTKSAKVSELISDFIDEIRPAFPYDSRIQSSLIHATLSMGLQGFYVFTTFIDSVRDKQTLTAATETGCNFIHMAQDAKDHGSNDPSIEAINNPEWINNFAPTALQLFVDQMQLSYSVPLEENEFVTEIVPMVNACYFFFSGTVTLLSGETVQSIFTATRDLMNRHYDCPGILDGIFKFLIAYVFLYPDDMTQIFADCSFSFILSPAFDPYRQRWERIFCELLNFHAQLYKKNHAAFCEHATEALGRMGASSEFIGEYLKNLELDSRKIPGTFQPMFQSLLVSRNRNTF